MAEDEKNKKNKKWLCAFSLTEVLIALLVVTITISALAPVLTKKITSDKTSTSTLSKMSGVPIGGVILWSTTSNLPDNTWLPCDGQLIPSDSKYDKLRAIFGTNIPNLNGNQNDTTKLKEYIDKKNNEQTIGKTFPKNIIAIWGTNDTIPEGWEEATEYQGVFLRGYGTTTFTQNNGSTIGNTSTTHTSGNLGEVQGDAVRNVMGYFNVARNQVNDPTSHVDPAYPLFYMVPGFNVGGLNTVEIRTGFGIVFDASRVVPTTTENRPINKAVKYIKCSGGPTYTSNPEDLTTNLTSMFRYIIKARS